MNVTAKLSKRPWRVERTKRTEDVYVSNEEFHVATVFCKKDAAFIVKAVNAHDKLIEALKEARDLLALNGIDANDTADYGNGRADDIVFRIEAALAAAGEQV